MSGQIVALNRRPATHLMSDILSPCAGNSIAAGQVGVQAGREEQTHPRKS